MEKTFREYYMLTILVLSLFGVVIALVKSNMLALGILLVPLGLSFLGYLWLRDAYKANDTLRNYNERIMEAYKQLYDRYIKILPEGDTPDEIVDITITGKLGQE